MDKINLNAMLSTDGEAMALDYGIGDAPPMRLILPVQAIPTLIDLLISVASKAKTASTEGGRVKIDRILQPSDIKIVQHDHDPDGALLRVEFGHLPLDFALTIEQSRLLRQAMGTNPASLQTPKRPS